MRRALRAPLVLVLLLVMLGACAPAAPGGPVIALLLPESKASRYESIDRPAFERVVAARCPDCRVLYANAGQDAARQQQQSESALTQGAKVLVIDAVDASSARSIATSAAARGVRVVAYDRFIADAPLDFMVGYDAVRVGQLQGEALVRAVGRVSAGSGILEVDGAETDPNVPQLREGLTKALANTGVTVLARYSTPDWSPDKAQEWVQGQLTQFAGRVVGVYAANDGTAGGAISAMRAAGIDPLPPVTGQDAELAAVQRIVAGEQTMTVYKSIDQQARTAAEIAVQLARGESPAGTTRVEGVPAILLTPVSVTRDSVGSVLVAGGVYTTAQICIGSYRQACRDIGLLAAAAG